MIKDAYAKPGDKDVQLLSFIVSFLVRKKEEEMSS